MTEKIELKKRPFGEQPLLPSEGLKLLKRAEQAERDRDSAQAELLDAAETERQLRAEVGRLRKREKFAKEAKWKAKTELSNERSRTAMLEAHAQKDAAALEEFREMQARFENTIDALIQERTRADRLAAVVDRVSAWRKKRGISGEHNPGKRKCLCRWCKLDAILDTTEGGADE